AFPVFPAAFPYRMRTVFAWPEAKPIVMLGRNDNSLHTGLLRDPRPLPRIQGAGSEYLRILVTVPPFQIRERIRPEMDEHIVFHLQPGHLLRAGDRQPFDMGDSGRLFCRLA